MAKVLAFQQCDRRSIDEKISAQQGVFAASDFKDEGWVLSSLWRGWQIRMGVPHRVTIEPIPNSRETSR